MEQISDFDFYLKFTKPLVLNLKLSEKFLAAAWIKKLMDSNSGEESLRLSYLKLLLFVLQRQKLSPPFTEHPNTIEQLQPLAEDRTLVDVAKDILKQEQQEKIQKCLQGESGDYPPYVSDFSADLLEYAAIQHIENFGIHGYYAVSKIPLNSWYKVDKHLLPKAAKSMVEVSPGPPPELGTSSEPSITVEKPEESEAISIPKEEVTFAEPQQHEEQAEGAEGKTESEAAEEKEPEPETAEAKEPEPREEETEPKVEEGPAEEPKPKTPVKKRTLNKSTLGATPPSRPIGKISPPSEDRKPPTWGSNLLELKDVIEETSEAKETYHPSTPELLAKADYLMTPDAFDIDEYADLGDLSPPSFSFLSSSPTHQKAEELDASFGASPYFPPESPDQAWTSAASLPYMTPPIPTVIPPPLGYSTPRVPKKKVPIVRQTRSSMLLQKKKEAALKPPPPPPPKKPVKKFKPKPVAKKVSSEEIQPPPQKAEPPAKKAAPKKKKTIGIAKKKVTKTPSQQLNETVNEIIGDISPGEPFKGFEDLDDVDYHLAEYNSMLQDMEEKYKEDQNQFTEKWKPKKSVTMEHKKPARDIPRPKRALSKLAKTTGLPIPKRHDASLPVEKSIHMSPEAMETVEEFSEAPSPTGDHAVSSYRHPTPRLSPEMFREEEEDADVEEQVGEVVELHARPKQPFIPGKNRRVSEFYKRMIETSQQMSPIAEVEDWEEEPDLEYFDEDEEVIDDDEDEEDIDVDFANISTEPDDMDWILQELEEAENDLKTFMAEAALSPQSTEGDMTVLQSAPVGGAEPDFDDFEAMERMVEEQMTQEGEDPHGRKKRIKKTKKSFAKGRKRFLEMHNKVDAQLEAISSPTRPEDEQVGTPSREFDPALYFQDMPSQEFGGIDAEQWVSADEFFKNKTMASPPPKDPRARPAEAMFPSIKFDEEDFFSNDQLDEFLVTSPPSTPEREFKRQQDVEQRYLALLQASPGLASVPVTSPRPSASPRRVVDYSEIIFTPPGSPEDPFGLPALKKPSNVEEYLEKKEKRARQQEALQQALKKPSPKARTPSPPPSPPRDYEDDLLTTVPPEELAEVEEDEYFFVPAERFDYEKKKVADVDTTGVSPPKKQWYTDAKKHMKNLYGTPEKRPDIFDIPAERLAGETPPKLVTPERRSLSPPIDTRALRDHIAGQPPIQFSMPYRSRVGPSHVVQRYSPAPVGLRPVREEEQHELLSQEDLDLQDYLSKMKKKKRRREVFRFPKYRRRTWIARHAPRPRLETVKEVIEPSPPKKVPNVFDLPDMYNKVWTESPPHTFYETPWVSPPASPADPEAWKENIRAQPVADYQTPYSRKVGGKHRVQRKSPAPGLEPVHEIIESASEDEWERRNIIAQSREVPTRGFGRIRRSPGLETVSEHIEYPSSPVSSRPIPASPRGTTGPRRRELRKKLKKRRIDFSLPESPDEAILEVEEVDAHVETPERHVYGTMEIPELSPWVYRTMQSPYRVPEGESPKTPPSRLLDLEEAPEGMHDLVHLTPDSPMSQHEAIEAMKREVRGHVYQPGRRRRYTTRELDHMARRRLPPVEEQAQEEHVARIHEHIEREVEAEIAAREAEIRQRESHLVDEPVPSGLPSPMKPQQSVPFYETPPHLKRPAIPKKEKQIDIWPKRYRDVLTYEEMPDFDGLVDSPPFTKSPLFTESPPQTYAQKGMRVSPPTFHVAETGGTPELGEEDFPQEMASPVSPMTAEDLQMLADQQYAELLGGDGSPTEGVMTTPELRRKLAEWGVISPKEQKTWPSGKPKKSKSPKAGSSWMPDDIDVASELPEAIDFHYEERVVEPSGETGEPETKTVEYDLDALEKLGVTEEDLHRMNLSDVPPRGSPSPDSPEARDMAKMYEELQQRDSRITRRRMSMKGKPLPTTYRFMPQSLERVPESDDVPPAKPSRFQFELAQLESQPPPTYHRLLPLVIPREKSLMYPMALDYDMGEEDVDMGLAETEAPDMDMIPGVATDAFDRLEAGLPEGFEDIEEIDVELAVTPPPPPYKSPEPVSPSKLKGELEKHEYYDPERKRMRKTVKVKGRTVKLRTRAPALGTVYERTPPRRAARPPPLPTTSMAEVMEEANRQYAELMSNRPLPPPKTPSPETLKYKVGKHKFDPRMYHKTFSHLAGKGTTMSPPLEVLEHLEPQGTPKRVSPMKMAVPHEAPHIGDVTPPRDYFMANYGDLYEEEEEEEVSGEPTSEEEVWAQQDPQEASPPQFYTPSPSGSPAEREEDFAADVFEQHIQEESPPFVIEETQEETVEQHGTPPRRLRTPENVYSEEYRMLMPSPPKPQRYSPASRPISSEDFGLPGVTNVFQLPETPRRFKKEGDRRRLPGRKLRFQRSPPSSPETPDGPHVTVMTVEAEVHSPRMPRRGPPTPPSPPTPPALGAEEMPSLLEDVDRLETFASPTAVPDRMVPFGGRTSPGVLDTSPIHYEEDIPENLTGFRWMDVEKM